MNFIKGVGRFYIKHTPSIAGGAMGITAGAGIFVNPPETPLEERVKQVVMAGVAGWVWPVSAIIILYPGKFNVVWPYKAPEKD